MDPNNPGANVQPPSEPSVPSKKGFIQNIKSGFSKFSSNYKLLPMGTKRLMSLGGVLSLLVAIPFVVLAIRNAQNFFGHAASGEPTGEPPTPTISAIVVPTPTPIRTPTPMPLPCRQYAPSILLTPSRQVGVKMQTLTYTVQVTNNNSSDCAPYTFTIRNRVPAGWVGVLSKQSVTIASGKQDLETLKVTPRILGLKPLAQGNYPVIAYIGTSPSSPVSSTAIYTLVFEVSTSPFPSVIPLPGPRTPRPSVTPIPPTPLATRTPSPTLTPIFPITCRFSLFGFCLIK